MRTKNFQRTELVKITQFKEKLLRFRSKLYLNLTYKNISFISRLIIKPDYKPGPKPNVMNDWLQYSTPTNNPTRIPNPYPTLTPNFYPKKIIFERFSSRIRLSCKNEKNNLKFTF